MKEKEIGVIYARYSKGPNQNEQSIEGQIADCMQYALDHNINVTKIYADRAMSGKESANRDEFQNMLDDSAKGIFSVIVTWKVDRFGRNREEIALNKYKLKKNGVKLCYAEEHIPDGPEGIILESLLEGLAEYYSADLAQKIKRGQRESTKKGRVLTVNRLYGYYKDDDLHYQIDENEAPFVKKSFEMYASGYLQKDIIAFLNDNGVVRYNGKPFDSNAIRRMLRNRQYIGEYSFGDTVNNEAIPPIIEKELFDAVQSRLNSTSKPRTQNSSSDGSYLLSSKCTCGICGYNYIGELGTSKNGKKHYYYKCRGQKKKLSDCKSPAIKKDLLEDFVVTRTLKDILDDNVLGKVVDELLAYQKENQSSKYASALNKQLKDVNKKIDNLLNAIEQGIFTDSTKSRLEDLENQKANIEISISAEKYKNRGYSKEQILYFLNSFKDKDINDEEYKKNLLKTFINQIVIDNEYIYITYNITGIEAFAPINEVYDCVRTDSHIVDLPTINPNTKAYILNSSIVLFVYPKKSIRTPS